MYNFRSNAYIEKITDLFDISNYHKKIKFKVWRNSKILSFQRTSYAYVQKSSFFVLKRRQKRNGGSIYAKKILPLCQWTKGQSQLPDIQKST